MKKYEVQQNNFCISTDKNKLDINVIHDYLCNESYWAKNIPVEIVDGLFNTSVKWSLS